MSLSDCVLRYFAATDGDPREIADSKDVDVLFSEMVKGSDGDASLLADYVRAYDKTIFLAAARGQRVVSDSGDLDRLADACLVAAGGEPRFVEEDGTVTGAKLPRCEP